MIRYSNHHDLDPAVYPYFEIYPKIQTVQSQAKFKSTDGAREFKSYIHPDPKEVSKRQPWNFGWPSSRPVSSPVSTSSSASTSTSSPAPKSMMVYPVIKICEFPIIQRIVSKLLANFDIYRPRDLSVLRCVPRRGTLHPCSTFQTSPTAKVFGRHQEVGGNETRLPGDKDM